MPPVNNINKNTQTYSTSCSVNNMHTTKMCYVSNTKLLLYTRKILKKNTVNTDCTNRMTSLTLHVSSSKLYISSSFKVSMAAYQWDAQVCATQFKYKSTSINITDQICAIQYEHCITGYLPLFKILWSVGSTWSSCQSVIWKQ